jgi:hypothetical protein
MRSTAPNERKDAVENAVVKTLEPVLAGMGGESEGVVVGFKAPTSSTLVGCVHAKRVHTFV